MAEARGRISSLGTVAAFLNGRACSDTLCHVLNRAFGHPSKPEERAAVLFAGGIMQHGYQCGMIWGATLAAGAEAHRLLGPGPQTEARTVIAAQRLVEAFRARNKHTDCLEITELDRSSSTMQMITYFLIKGGSIGCFRMAAKFAPVAFREIDNALADAHVDAPPPPVSCAVLLARKMSASDEHTAMVAGFAGGIGLCGGACGALGAAIWIASLSRSRDGARKIGYNDPAALGTIDRFMKCTDYEFECARIVGRRFKNIADHADYLRAGGCSQLIDALAAG